MAMIALAALNMYANNSFRDATASGFSFCSCRQRTRACVNAVTYISSRAQPATHHRNSACAAAR